ncbi:MAG: hypothetical protein NC410_07025 [Oscillibacter sp.]|nr:hypothetical protein [Oscillibacter sp.]
MECSDIISICAIILGPIFAVQIEKYLERRRENKNRRLSIFKTLMATRGSVLSWNHVEALNRIDLEFSGNKKFEKVIQAWKAYFDNLSQKYTPEEEVIWVNKNQDLLADLLYEMGHSLGFGFDKILIKRNVYSPVGHAKIEFEQEKIRKSMLEILSGDKGFPITLISDDEAIKKQEELQSTMLAFYKNQIEHHPN